MQLINTLISAALALATLTTAKNTIQFINQDSTNRTIVFTSNEDAFPLPNLNISGNSQANQTFPTGYVGNFFSCNADTVCSPGMLGEVSFDSWGGLVFWDVSSIVNNKDFEGVKVMYAAGEDMTKSTTITSGCLDTSEETPCTNQYNAWDDIATKATLKSDLVCLLGTPSALKRKNRVRAADVYPRSYVLGQEGRQEE